MIEVYEKKKIPENCETCLYGGWQNIYSMSCGHADRQRDFMRYRLLGNCPSYWLDQHRFERCK